MEARVRRLERRTFQQELREMQDPFDLTDVEFKELYRLTPDIISHVVDELEPRLQRTRITGLSVEKQVCIVFYLPRQIRSRKDCRTQHNAAVLPSNG